jgi:hypothetical protein
MVAVYFPKMAAEMWLIMNAIHRNEGIGVGFTGDGGTGGRLGGMTP